VYKVFKPSVYSLNLYANLYKFLVSKEKEGRHEVSSVKMINY